LRPGDTITRLGGDEFAVLIEESRSPDAAIACAERIFALFDAPIPIGKEDMFCSFSMGICPSTLGYGQAENMMQDAKLALARAKTTGGSCYAVFEVEMRADSGGQLRLEADLRRAIEAGDQLRAYYQPIVEASCGRPIGFEALVRWQHPSRGLIGPADFIGLAEDSGLIVPVGRWVLRTAARQIAEYARSPSTTTGFTSASTSRRDG
jgi:predicted signal transduction protein with EAL and GGDEF domain